MNKLEVGFAVVGQGQMGGGIARLLTSDSNRIEEHLSITPELKQIFARPLKGTQGAENILQVNAKNRAGILASDEFWPSVATGKLIRADGEKIAVNGHRVDLVLSDILDEKGFEKLNSNVSVLIDSTGVLKKVDDVKTVMGRINSNDGIVFLTTYVVGQGKDGEKMPILVVGVNDDQFEPKKGSQEISNVSCTTKALAVSSKPVFDKWGMPEFYKAKVTHGLTPTQNLYGEASLKDPRRARSASSTIIPTTTNASEGLRQLFPGIKAPATFSTVRVDERDASFAVVEFSYPLRTEITEAQINDLLKQRAEEIPQALEYTEEPIVSADVRCSTKAAVIDAATTKVYNTPFCRVAEIGVWYAHAHGSQAQAIFAAEAAVLARNR